MYGLYAITPERIRGFNLVSQVEQAIQGGARLIQYREKGDAGAEKFTEAKAILHLCRINNVQLIINDDVELAYAIAADGVHLGRNDSDPVLARQKLGHTAIIGVSCYNNLDLAVKAQLAGANYVAFGRFFSSTTKPQATGATLELLYQAKSHVHLPIVAIGGITATNGKFLINAGADMLAVVGGIFSSEDIKVAALNLSSLFVNKVI